MSKQSSQSSAPFLDISSTLAGGYHHPLLRKWQSHPNVLTKSSLVYPIFITDEPDACVPILSLPGQCRWGVNKLEGFLKPLIEKGLRSVILFGVPVQTPKDEWGTQADSKDTPVIQALELLSKLFPSLLLVVDVCLCEYTSHGHCGIPSYLTSGPSYSISNPLVPNHANGAPHLDSAISAQRIAQVSLAYAKAGAHVVAPSDMMDGRIKAIKLALINEGMANRVAVMSYSAKFASALYGPFREAAGSAPMAGDRKCYQLPPFAKGLAKRAINRDVAEGADFIMVKPSLPYLDVIQDCKILQPEVPTACYQVSGEYAMIYAGAEKGVYELRSMAEETIGGMIRAGASIILTYFTPQFLDWLDEEPLAY